MRVEYLVYSPVFILAHVTYYRNTDPGFCCKFMLIAALFYLGWESDHCFLETTTAKHLPQWLDQWNLVSGYGACFCVWLWSVFLIAVHFAQTHKDKNTHRYTHVCTQSINCANKVLNNECPSDIKGQVQYQRKSYLQRKTTYLNSISCFCISIQLCRAMLSKVIFFKNSRPKRASAVN